MSEERDGRRRAYWVSFQCLGCPRSVVIDIRIDLTESESDGGPPPLGIAPVCPVCERRLEDRVEHSSTMLADEGGFKQNAAKVPP